MTPLAPQPRPQRLPILDEMLDCLRKAPVHDAAIQEDTHTKHTVLAICEIAMSLPPNLYTAAERMEIIRTVAHLYGEPFDFLRALNDGVSFVESCPEECNYKSVQEIVMGIVSNHRKEFGVDLLKSK